MGSMEDRSLKTRIMASFCCFVVETLVPRASKPERAEISSDDRDDDWMVLKCGRFMFELQKGIWNSELCHFKD